MSQSTEPENNFRSHHQQSSQQKKPEFIILEGTAEYINGPQQKPTEGEDDVLGGSADFFKGKPLRFMITLRLLSLIMTLVCIWWVLCSFLVLALSIVFAVVFLFRSPACNLLLQRFWKLFKLSLVSLVSFFLAIFSPAFGMGTLFLYASLSENTIFRHWLKRFRNIRGL